MIFLNSHLATTILVVVVSGKNISGVESLIEKMSDPQNFRNIVVLGLSMAVGH